MTRLPKKGFLLGGLLGAGFMWLMTTKKGQETREKLTDQAAELYAQIKNRIVESDAWDKMSRSEYVTLVKEVVDRYVVDNPDAVRMKKVIVRLLVSQWENLREELKKVKKEW